MNVLQTSRIHRYQFGRAIAGQDREGNLAWASGRGGGGAIALPEIAGERRLAAGEIVGEQIMGQGLGERGPDGSIFTLYHGEDLLEAAVWLQGRLFSLLDQRGQCRGGIDRARLWRPLPLLV